MATGSPPRVVDADAHANPLPSIWSEYLPAPMRHRAPCLERGGKEDAIVFEGRRTPLSRLNSQAGTRAEDQQPTGRLDDARPGGWDAAARLADMDLDGVDAAAIFGGGPLATTDPELYVASFRAYNRWLADFCAAAPERLLGMAYIPMFDVDLALDELRWAREHGLRGAVIPAYAPPPRYTGGAMNVVSSIMYVSPDEAGSYADERYEPFWCEADHLAMPLHVHLGAARPAEIAGPDARYRIQMRSKLAMAEVIVHFVMTGILPRHPDLRLVSVEGGVGWFAFAAEYLDSTWRKHRHSTASLLEEEPSWTMDRQVYGTFLEDAPGVRNREQRGARNIMWSSDYPHSETSWPDSQALIERSLKGLPDEDRERIVSGNARMLYRL